VLKKPQPAVVQIGSLTDIAKAVPANFANANSSAAAGKPVNIAPVDGNGNGSSEHKPEQAAEAVAGD
jgi:hypothetical protein